MANSVGDGQSWKTENGNGPTRSREAHRFVREGREIEKDVYNIHSQ